jgi:hypothetical protein
MFAMIMAQMETQYPHLENKILSHSTHARSFSDGHYR